MQGTSPISGTMSPGTLLLGDRFKVVKLLGGGGMGEVYLAEQLSLGRKVALKVLRSEMGAVHGMGERFKREALLLSSVDHPSVVRIIDFGESNGAACLVMDLVEGDTLEAILRDGPLAPPRVQVLLRQLAEGLAAVHARGIVHRDLKPQNVIVCEGPLGEQARLLDFGIARLTEGEGPGGGVTQAGIVIGTPEYLSPEQAVAGKFDDRSDLYSLGILAYYMLSAKLPLPGPSAREYIIQHATMPARPLLEVAPQLSPYPTLVGLVMQCLEKRPEDRPRSAAAIAQALAGVPSPSGPIEVTPSMVLAGSGPAVTSAERLSAVAPPPSAPPLPSGATRAVPPPSLATPAAAAPLDSFGVGFLPTTASPSRDFMPAGAAVAPPPAAPLAPGRDFVPTAPVAPTVKAPGSLGRTAAIAGAVVVAAVGAVVLALVLGPNPLAQAQALVDDGQPQEALRALEQVQKKDKKLPAAAAFIRAQALHDLDRHEDEWEALGRVGNSDLEGITAGAFASLMADYGRGNNEEPLIAILDRAPREKYNARAGAIARKREPAKAAWGALRFWDRTGADKGALVDPYIAALETEDCDIKGRAAKRLGDLGDLDALEALQAVVDSPRPRVAIFLTSCGHDEANAAIARIKKKK